MAVNKGRFFIGPSLQGSRLQGTGARSTALLLGIVLFMGVGFIPVVKVVLPSPVQLGNAGRVAAKKPPTKPDRPQHPRTKPQPKALGGR